MSENTWETYPSAISVDPEPPRFPHLRSRASVSLWEGGVARAPFFTRTAEGH